MSLLTSLFRLIPPSFRTGYCPATLQQLANDLISGTQVTFLVQQGSFLYNMGSATPAPENRIFPWLYTPNGQWYTFQYGLWVAPMDPSERELDFRKMWKPAAGTPESALWSLDGGDGSDPRATLPGGAANPVYVAPSATTGAAWEVDHDFDGAFAVGAGLIPGSSPAVTLAVGDTGGANTHVLTQAELPNINLSLTVKGGDTAPQDPGHWALVNPTLLANPDITVPVPLGGSDTPINMMPPYRAIYWIMPTTRRFFTLPA